MRTTDLLILAAAAAANAGYTTNDGPYKCGKPNASYCLGSDIILRCDEYGQGTPGRCSDNLAGYPPLGGVASCYENPYAYGEAACQKNCVVYYAEASTFPPDQCTPSYTSTTAPVETLTTIYTQPTYAVTTPHYNSTSPGGPGYTSKPGPPDYTTKPGEPDYTTKPEEPDYTTKPEEPEYTTKPEEPDYTTKPEEPEYSSTTEPGNPEYTTKPGHSGYPGYHGNSTEPAGYTTKCVTVVYPNPTHSGESITRTVTYTSAVYPTVPGTEYPSQTTLYPVPSGSPPPKTNGTCATCHGGKGDQGSHSGGEHPGESASGSATRVPVSPTSSEPETVTGAAAMNTVSGILAVVAIVAAYLI